MPEVGDGPPLTRPADRRAAVPVRTGSPRRRWSDDPDLRESFERALKSISDDLSLLRERQGWSLEQSAQAAGVDAQTVLDIETLRTDPRVSTFVRLAFVYGFELRLRLRQPDSSRVDSGRSRTS